MPEVPLPLLSVITACRNDAIRLRRTLQSLQAFYEDLRFEHVVVDGNSIDGTDILIAPMLSKPNFRFVKGKDSGIYDAMNRGTSVSKGEWILFLNCGDALTVGPNFLFDELSVLSTQYSDHVDIACYSVQQVGEKGGKKVLLSEDLPKHRMPTSHQGMVFSRLFALRNPYHAAYKIAGDFDIYLRAEPHRVIVRQGMDPWASVEVDGFASTHPRIAYYEYLQIARDRLKGGVLVRAWLRIALRASAVIVLKAAVSRRWISWLRGV